MFSAAKLLAVAATITGLALTPAAAFAGGAPFVVDAATGHLIVGGVEQTGQQWERVPAPAFSGTPFTLEGGFLRELRSGLCLSLDGPPHVTADAECGS